MRGNKDINFKKIRFIIKARDFADYHFANNPAWVLAVTVLFSIVVSIGLISALS